ncbi:MAG: serine/threonine-protein kinase [Nannocystaceae bacterium]
MSPADPITALGEIQLESSRVEVRLTRAAVKARLFGRPPQATRIGRFVVLERVGMGGMGIVYAAYDPQLDRRVALKVMRDDVVRSRRPQQQTLLLQEARAMAKLSHPNVVSVYDAGTADGQVFVAMEFVDAVTLRAWLDPPPPPEERMRVLCEAGLGLSMAHAAGLVHRDFKPENVLVPEQGAARVTDFGLARPVETDGPAGSGAAWASLHDMTLGSSQGLAGTPAYMSPQQMRGEVVDARADQWAFCVVLYEAFAGRRPYDWPQLQALARGEAVPLPSLPDTGVPAPVRTVVERGLSLRPDDRFADMDALLTVLSPRRSTLRAGLLAAMAGLVLAAGVGLGRSTEPTCERATDRLDEIWDAPTRERLASGMQAASPALGSDAWTRVEAVVQPQVESWLDLRQASCRAAEDGELSSELFDLRMACLDARHGELRALVDTLAQADAQIVAGAVESALRLTPLSHCTDPRALRRLTPPPPSPARDEASSALRARVDAARALRRAGKASQALPRIDAVVREADALGEPGVIIDARLERGLTRAELAERDGAAEDFDAVIEQGGRVGYLGAVTEASIALVDLVGVDLARLEAGLDLARMASLAVALGTESSLDRARVQLARGRVLYLAGRIGEGLQTTQRGLEGLDGSQSDDRARLEQARALQLMAKLALAADDYDRARTYAERAQAIFEQVLGAAHPLVAQALAHRAAAALRVGAVAEAREQLERVAEIQRGAYGEQHPDYGRTVANLGSAMHAGGDPAGALQQYQRAAAILELALGADDPRVASLWINIGGVQATLGHAEPALRAYQRGLAGLRASLGEHHPQTALALANLGRLQLDQGELDAARDSQQLALEIREEVLGSDHIETARSRRALGDVLLARGERDAADRAYARALDDMIEGEAPAAEIAQLRAEIDALSRARTGRATGR